jgi:hypothetical protein
MTGMGFQKQRRRESKSSRITLPTDFYKKRVLPLVLALMIGCAQPDGLTAPPLSNQPPEGFISLFNGENLDGLFGHGTEDPRVLWAMTPEELEAHKDSTRANIREHWSIEDG